MSPEELPERPLKTKTEKRVEKDASHLWENFTELTAVEPCLLRKKC
jgi:hypothetical protein